MKKLLIASAIIGSIASVSASAANFTIDEPTLLQGSGLLVSHFSDSTKNLYTFGGDFVNGEPVTIQWDSSASESGTFSVDVSSTLSDWSLSVFDSEQNTAFNIGPQLQNTNSTASFSMAANTVYSILLNGVSPINGFSVGFSSANLDVSEVPLPAAAWLFGSALLGGAALKRRAKNQKQA